MDFNRTAIHFLQDNCLRQLLMKIIY